MCYCRHLAQSQSLELSRGTCHESTPFCVRFEYDRGSSGITSRLPVSSFHSLKLKRACWKNRSVRQPVS